MVYEHLKYAYMILKNVDSNKKIVVLHWYSYSTLYYMFENKLKVSFSHWE